MGGNCPELWCEESGKHFLQWSNERKQSVMQLCLDLIEFSPVWDSDAKLVMN